MLFEQPVTYASLSDIGFRRQNNQDSCAVNLWTDREGFSTHGHLFVVADGMGGHAVGELASKLATDSLPQAFAKATTESTSDALRNAIVHANKVIHERGEKNLEFQRMGTTCTALVLNTAGVTIGHVGDSRAYRVRGGQIDQLTCDHSLVWELIHQRKIDPKDISAAVPKNIITRSLGIEADVRVDIEGPFVALPGDVYILCSDGLTNMVSDPEIGVAAKELPPAEACRFLVNLANLRGGLDNITVVIVKIGNRPENAETEMTLPSQILRAPTDVLSWGGLIWLATITLLGLPGIGLAVFSEIYRPWGYICIGTSVAILLIGLYLRRKYAPPVPVELLQNKRQGSWKPYRTAPAKLSPDLFNRIRQLHDDLVRAARQEQWQIDWKEHEKDIARTNEGVQERKLARAFRDLTLSIQVLMAGLQLHRNQIRRESRWTRTSDRLGDTPLP